MALKYAIGSQTFDRVSAESILESVEGMNNAYQDLVNCQGRLAEAEQVMESLQIALDTISTFGVGEESLGILDADGSLQACLGLQAPSLESLESMSEKSLESLDKKWESAIEGKLANAWEAVKNFFRELWNKICEYASRFWNWLRGLFSKNKEVAAEAKKATDAAKTAAPKAADAAVAASTSEEEQKAKTEIKEEAAKAPEAVKQKVADAVAKTAEKAAPEGDKTPAGGGGGGPSAPCNYKAAMDAVGQMPGQIQGIRQMIGTMLGKIKSMKAVDLYNMVKKSHEGMPKDFQTFCTEVAKAYEKENKMIAGLGFELKINKDGNLPRINYAPKALTGNNTQLGWKSVTEIQSYMAAYANMKLDMLSDTVVKQVSDQCLACIDKFEKELDAAWEDDSDSEMIGSKDENAGMIASMKSEARRLFTMLSNAMLDAQKAAVRVSSRLQEQFNWCKRKSSMIASATRAAINS